MTRAKQDSIDKGEASEDLRTRVLAAALDLIDEGGVAALTTRAVAQAAGVQAPTLYRLFGDKRGLLDAVAENGMARFIAEKIAAEPHPNPVQDLRDAWHHYIAFGQANPAVFAITNEIGSPAARSPAALAGMAVLERRVRRIARTGQLRVAEKRAVALIHAAGVGTVSTLLSASPDMHGNLADDACDAIMAVILTEPSGAKEQGMSAQAIGLRAHLGENDQLTDGERLLLGELLDRLAAIA